MKNKKNFDAASAISEGLQDKEHLKHTASLLKKFSDGKPVNENPLKEIPEPEMILYMVRNKIFETQEELENYCRTEAISTKEISTLEYIRYIADCTDVIRQTYRNRSILYVAVDEDGYAMYNNERSIYCGKYIWEYNYGNIRNMYAPFRERGIIFENDIYEQIDENNKKVYQMCREHNLFNMEKNNNN